MSYKKVSDIHNIEHDETATAKRVLPVDSAGDKISHTNPLPVEIKPETDGNPQTFEDTNFVTGSSPATLDVNAALGRNATQFTLINDGAGNFTVALSNDGAAFGDEHTVKNGEVYSLDRYSLDTIRITWVADSAYRVVVI